MAEKIEQNVIRNIVATISRIIESSKISSPQQKLEIINTYCLGLQDGIELCNIDDKQQQTGCPFDHSFGEEWCKRAACSRCPKEIFENCEKASKEKK